jgi:hypothetical protein
VGNPDVAFVGDLETAVKAAKDAAGGRKYVNVLGANVAKQCLEAGVLPAGRRTDQLVVSRPSLEGSLTLVPGLAPRRARPLRERGCAGSRPLPHAALGRIKA